MIKTEKRRARAVAGELVVPAIMLLFVGVYWLDAAGLSAEALAFPSALTAVIVLAIAAIVVRSLLSSNPAEAAAPVESAWFRRWMIVLVPIVLIAFWRYLGAVPVIFFYTAWLLYILGERRRRWLIGVPSVLAFALVYLFKSVLYVRLPDILLMSGS